MLVSIDLCVYINNSSFKSFEMLTIKCKVNHKIVGKMSFSEIVTSQTNAYNADKLAFVLRKLI